MDRQIPFSTRYFVTDEGVVYSMRAGGPKPLASWVNNSGYRVVAFWFPRSKQVNLLVHRIVCTMFHGQAPTPAHEAAHRDGCQTNNRADNLHWLTHRENELEKLGPPTVFAMGEAHVLAKLTDADVDAMRAMKASGDRVGVIARRFPHVSYDHVRRVLSGRTRRSTT